MGEGDRGAGSLHFFVPGPRVRAAAAGAETGAMLHPEKPGRKPVPFIFCVRPRERGGCDAAEAESETEAKPHQEERRKGRTARAKARARRAPGRRGPRPEQKRSPKRKRSPIRRSGEGPDGTRKSTGEKRVPRESDIVGLPGNSPLPVHCRPHYLLNMPA